MTGFDPTSAPQSLIAPGIDTGLSVDQPELVGNSRHGLVDLLDLTHHFATEQIGELQTVLDTADPQALQMLYGVLAVHLAGRANSPDATPAEHAEVVEESILDIASKKDLRLGIAQAAFSHAVTTPGVIDVLGTPHAAGANQDGTAELSKKQQRVYERLRKTASREGALYHYMLEPGQPVLLEYRPTSGDRTGRVELSLEPLEKDSVTKPSKVYSEVEKIEHRHFGQPAEVGYGRQGTHQWPVYGAFMLTGVRDTAHYGATKINLKYSFNSYEKVEDDSTLPSLTDQVVSLGTMTQGEPMQLQHDFRAPDMVTAEDVKNLKGLSTYPQSASYSPQLELVQAYFAGNKNYPIFDPKNVA